MDNDKLSVINYYDDVGPVEVNIERIKSYAKEQGIKAGEVTIRNGYFCFTPTEWHPCSLDQEWINSRRIETSDDKHLASVGHDTQGGDKS